MPYEIPECAGTPYIPSNGTEGEGFQECFCYRCRKDEFDLETCEGESCPILMAALMYDVDDSRYPPEWTHDERGRPTCTAFEAEEPEL